MWMAVDRPVSGQKRLLMLVVREDWEGDRSENMKRGRERIFWKEKKERKEERKIKKMMMQLSLTAKSCAIFYFFSHMDLTYFVKRFPCLNQF